MPRSNAFIPVARGQNTALDERLRAPDQLTKVVNGTYVRDGAISKRNGFAAVTTTVLGASGTVATEGEPRGLFSTGDELCVRGYRTLFTYDTLAAGWRARGPLSPVVLTQRGIWHDGKSPESSDMAVQGNYCAYFAVSTYQDGTITPTAGINYETRFTSRTLSGSVVFADTLITGLGTGGTQRQPFSGAHAIAIGGGTQFRLFFQTLDDSIPLGQIFGYKYTAGSATAPVAVVGETTLYLKLTEQAPRRYDACGLPGPATTLGSYAYVFADNVSAGLIVRIMTDNDAVVVSSVPLAMYAQAELCTIVYDGGTGSGTNYLYVVGSVNVDPTVPHAAQLLFWRLNADTGAVVNGPVTLDAPSSYYLALGACIHVDPTTGDRQLVVTTTNRDGDPNEAVNVVQTNSYLENVALARNSYYVRELRLDLATRLVASAVHLIYNCHAASKPWSQGGRCYLAVNSDVEQDGFGGASILDLGVGPVNAGHPTEDQQTVAAAYNFGSAPGEGASALQGSLPNVSAAGAAAVRFLAYGDAYKVKGQTARLDVQEVSVDYSAAPMVASVSRGAALIGGGAAYWYAGALTEELGYLSPPEIPGVKGSGFYGLVSSTTAGGTLTAGGTYSYQVVLEAYDERGNWLRSVPSPARDVTLGGAHNTVDVTARSDGLTSRYGRRTFAIVVYRAASDGLFMRASEPLSGMLARQSPYPAGWFFPAFRDQGKVSGPLIYTQSAAELDAATPDGASIVLGGAQRAFLSGFPRRDRVQYSKILVPSTATQDAVAPEFNEALSFLLPHGEACTGLAELDDKLIVFTATAIYALAGRGPDDGGRNSDYSGLTKISTDTGCVEPRSVVTFPGGVMFLSAAGIYALGRGLDLSFVGSSIRDELNGNCVITSAVAFSQLDSCSHVRFTVRDRVTDLSGILVYDYTVGQSGAWCKWVPKDAAGAALDLVGGCVHQGTYYVLTSSGTVYSESASAYKDAGVTFVPLTVATSWLQAAQQSGWNRVRQFAVLCARKDPHDLTLSVFQDFETSASQTYTWTAAQIAAQANPTVREQCIMRLSRQKCTAVKFQVSDAASASTVTGQGYTLAGFVAELGVKRGLVKAGSPQRN